jgi:hypothetical protein
MDCCMVSTDVVFALVVSKILFSWVVFDVKLPCLNSICNPEKNASPLIESAVFLLSYLQCLLPWSYRNAPMLVVADAPFLLA